MRSDSIQGAVSENIQALFKQIFICPFLCCRTGLSLIVRFSPIDTSAYPWRNARAQVQHLLIRVYISPFTVNTNGGQTFAVILSVVKYKSSHIFSRQIAKCCFAIVVVYRTKPSYQSARLVTAILLPVHSNLGIGKQCNFRIYPDIFSDRLQLWMAPYSSGLHLPGRQLMVLYTKTG